MRGSQQVFLTKRELTFLKCQNDDLTENANVFLHSFTCLFWSLNWIFFFFFFFFLNKNTGLSFTIMSYIIECMLCWECCRIYIRKRFEYARCGRVFFRSGGKNLRFKKYPDACGQNLRTRRSRGQRVYEAKRHVDPIHFTTCYIWEDRHDCCLKVKDYLRIDP